MSEARQIHPLPDRPLEPPAHLPGIQESVWCALPADDPLAAHLAAHYWGRPEPPAAWEVARLSGAVYLYRETATGWAVAAKFYAAKTGAEAEHYARREFDDTQRARAFGLADDPMRALAALVAQALALLSDG